MVVAGMLLASRSASAQADRTSRMYRGLFGSDNRSAVSKHQLDFSLGVNGAADDGYSEPASPDGDPTVINKHFEELYFAGAKLAYTRRGRSVQFGAASGVSFPYYSVNPDYSSLAGNASGDVAYSSGRTSFGGSASYRYSPFYSLSIDPGSLPSYPDTPINPSGPYDYASALSRNHALNGSVSFNRRLSRPTSVSVGYNVGTMLFVDDGRSTFDQSVRLSASRIMSRSTSLNGGYGYSQTDAKAVTSAPSTTTRWHDVDVGAGYSRPSPRGQQFSASASIGTSLFDVGQDQTQSLDQRLRWRWSAEASRSIHGNWAASASYSRSLQYVGGLLQPVWADQVNAQAGGLIGQRVSLSFGAGYSTGDYLVGSTAGYDAYSGSVRSQFALTSYMQLNVQYIYYRYDFPPGFDLPPGMQPLLGRQRVQIGAGVWLPLVRAGRAPEPRPTVNQ